MAIVAAAGWFAAATVLIPVRVTFGGGSLRCGTVLHPDRLSETADVCGSSDAWSSTVVFGALAAGLFLVGHRAWRRRGLAAPLLAGGAGLGWVVSTGVLLMWLTGAHAAPAP